MTGEICIIGGGMTGTAAAYALRDADVDVTIFESNRKLGGRMATERRDDCVYDIGSNHIETPPDHLFRALREAMGEDLVGIEGPIWHFDWGGTIDRKDTEGLTRLTGRDGMDTVPQALADGSGATVELNTAVTSLKRTDDGWVVTDDDGKQHDADAVVLATASPAAIDLLEDADWDDPLRDELLEAARDVGYRPVPVVVAHYPFAVDRPYFGLVGDDPGHLLNRVYREDAKPGRVPEDEAVFVTYLNAQQLSADVEDVPGTVGEATDALADLLDDDRLADPDWTDYRYWDLALPEHGLSHSVLDRGLRHDIAPVGDWVVGVGRTYATLELGYEAGQRLARQRE